jgi:RNA-binding protein YhbY
VKKELLSIGKSGVSQSHRNSLKELLAQHPEGVKVRLNHTAVDAELTIANLTDETGAMFLQRKGRTLLFVSDTPPQAAKAIEFTRQSGQWLCESCAFDNFATRTKCFKCGEPKEPKE